MKSAFALFALALTCGASAQPVTFTQWNFNALPANQIVNNPAPSIGRGTAVPLGMTNNYTYSLLNAGQLRVGSTTTCDITGSGASSESGTVPNNCWRVRGSYDGTLVNAGVGWALAAPQFTQGAEFDVSTVNFSGITLTFDWFTTNQGVNKMQVQYSTDGGANWINIGNVLTSATNAWINNLTYDFSSIPAANDNPNFRVRMVSVYDPVRTIPATFTISSTTFTAAQLGLVAGAPAYGGASSTLYNNASGNWRFDAVTFKGTAIRSVSPAILTTASTPIGVCASGGQVLLTATAQGGAGPLSTGLSSSQQLFDDGTNGDAIAGDGIYSFLATVPAGQSVGAINIPVTVADAQSRSGSGSIALTVANCATNSNSRVVISQVFGGGGNLGAIPAEDAPFNADYVEIYNRSNQVVSIDGWSVQYASQAAPGGFTSSQDIVPLSGTLQPGQYALIRMSDPVPGFNALPTPDFAQLPGFGGMGNQGGRVALVRSLDLLNTNYNSPSIEDSVGYGNGAITFEGAAPTATPSPLNNKATLRKNNGAQDTNQNFNDFVTGAPNPRNRTFGGFLTGYASITPVSLCSGTPALFTVQVVGGGSGVSVTADLTEIAGAPTTLTLRDNGLNGDVAANDGIYSANFTVPITSAQALRTVNFTITDSIGGNATAKATLAIGSCNPTGAPIVISKVYGGGGNALSGFDCDFAEIFNRSDRPYNLTGWSFQSARVGESGFDTRMVPLSGIIQPGQYKLIITNQRSSTVGVAVPAADFTAPTPFGMESSFGRVALASTTTFIGTDYTRGDVVDLVGYGQLAQSYEGVAPTPPLGDIYMAVRKQNGCQDTNNNAVDFDVVLALTLPNNGASPVNLCSIPRCNLADVARLGGQAGPDGQNTADDLILFLNAFFTNNFSVADIATLGGALLPDNQLTVDDLIAYLNAFFAPCN
jgi:hypothetical protein